MHLNYEWKARIKNLYQIEQKLVLHQPDYIGEDYQTDTYFNVPHGRLKLREGTIENALIHYQRSNIAGAKQSSVILYPHAPDASFKEALIAALGIKVVVIKCRHIYFVDNVKFHFDTVEGLGTFAEVEAIDKEGNMGMEKLQEQCTYWATFFSITPDDYLASSYSDMLLHKEG